MYLIFWKHTSNAEDKYFIESIGKHTIVNQFQLKCLSTTVKEIFMFEYSEIREGFKVKLFQPIKNQWQAPAELSKHEQFSLQDDTQGFFILSMLLSIFHIEKKN